MVFIRQYIPVFLIGALFLTACQSDKSTQKYNNLPQSDPEANYHSGIDILTSADQEYQEYHRNLAKINLHFSTTLHAVNRYLFVKPDCVSGWFDSISKIDLELQTLLLNEEKMFKVLRKQHQMFLDKQHVELEKLEKIRFDLSHNDSRMQILLPQMSQILAHVMQENSGC